MDSLPNSQLLNFARHQPNDTCGCIIGDNRIWDYTVSEWLWVTPNDYKK